MSTILLKESVFKPLNADSLRDYLNQFKQELTGKVDQLWLFGSAARGDYREESDIDIAFLPIYRCFTNDRG